MLSLHFVDKSPCDALHFFRQYCFFHLPLAAVAICPRDGSVCSLCVRLASKEELKPRLCRPATRKENPMKKFLKTLLALTLATAFLLTGCETPDVSSETSLYEQELAVICDSISFEEIQTVEQRADSFAGADFYKEILDLYAYPVGITLSWDKVENMPVEKLLRFYFINAFAVDAKDITTQNPDMTYGAVFYMPSEYVERYLTRHFLVELDFLRKSEVYDKNLDAYAFNEEGGRGGQYDYTFLGAEECENDITKLYIKYTTNYENIPKTAYAVLVIQKFNEGDFKYLCAKNFDNDGNFVGFISDPTLRTECEMMLSNFSESMLLNNSFTSTEEISVSNLVAWYGYRMKAEGKTDRYVSDKWDGLLFPSKEFEDVMYRYFGLIKENLRKSDLYSKEHQGYFVDGALYPLADNNYHLTQAEVSGNIYKIYFDFTVADHVLEFCVLTAEKDGENIRFVSYSRQERLPELN